MRAAHPESILPSEVRVWRRTIRKAGVGTVFHSCPQCGSPEIGVTLDGGPVEWDCVACKYRWGDTGH